MAIKLIRSFEHGLTWVQDEWMQRASHALLVGGRVWLVDPVDDPEPLEQARALGPIAGVLQLLDRHPRACHSLADHYGVPLHRLPDELPGEPALQVLSVLRARGWQERAIWWPDTSTLVVAELVGTNPYYALSSSSPVGVHPLVRGLVTKHPGEKLPVQHLLVGHGAPVHDGAAQALATAYRRRLRDLPLLPLRGPRAFLRTGR